jgi:O-antigen/teichoic acid export membrane protein
MKSTWEQMSREFLINLIFLLFINALVKPVYIFWIDRTVQNVVGQEYGIYFSLLSFSYLFQIINDFGLQNFNARNISRHRSLVHKYLPGILRLKAILGVLYSGVVLLAAYLIGYEGDYMVLLFWIVIIQLMTSFLLYLRSNIAGLGFYRMDSFLSILDKLLLIIICGTMFLTPALRDSFKIEWFLYAQIGALACGILVASMYILPKVKLSAHKVKYTFMWLILKQSYPFALIYILMMVYTRIDAVMLERMLEDGVQESFTYASAYRLLDAANMITYLFVGLLLPMFSRMLGQKEAIGPLFEVSIIFISFGQLFGALLIANGTVLPLNKIYIGGIIINITSNLILIPHWKAYGAALSTLFTEVFVAISLGLMIYKTFKGLWQWRWVLKILGYSFLTGFAIFTSYQYLDLDWKWHYFLTLAMCAGLSFVLRMIPSKEMLKVLQINQRIKSNDSEIDK